MHAAHLMGVKTSSPFVQPQLLASAQEVVYEFAELSGWPSRSPVPGAVRASSGTRATGPDDALVQAFVSESCPESLLVVLDLTDPAGPWRSPRYVDLVARGAGLWQIKLWQQLPSGRLRLEQDQAIGGIDELGIPRLGLVDWLIEYVADWTSCGLPQQQHVRSTPHIYLP